MWVKRCTCTLLACTLVSAFLVSQSLASDQASQLPQLEPSEMHAVLGARKAEALQQRMSSIKPASVLSQAGFNALYYEIDLFVDEGAQTVSGHVTMLARAQQDGFDAPNLNLLNGLTVDSVTSPDGALAWTHASDFIFATLITPVDTDEEFSLTVYYHGHPPTGGFQGFLVSTHSGVPITSTLSEPYYAQSWWPCKDTPSDKADSVDVHITTNSAFYVVSNGNLRDSTDNGNGTTTYWWHESYPITTYLVSLAITNYARFERWYHYGPGDVDSLPVRFYSYPEKLSDALLYWPITVDQIGFYAETFCEYPFLNEKYGIAHFNWGGAMEHQTVSSHTGSGFGFLESVVAHELGHQWFGDMITCRDWHHIWLNEGFASYCEALWFEHKDNSIQTYLNYMSSLEGTARSLGRVYVDDTTSLGAIFSNIVYDKGAWVLHMLRGYLGDQDFFNVLSAYANSQLVQYGDAVTEDFRDIAEVAAKTNLDWFFDQWIYGYAYPKLVTSWLSEPANGGWDIFFHIRQEQTANPLVFQMPYDILISGEFDSDTVSIFNAARDEDYIFHVDFDPQSLTVDPANWVLNQTRTEGYTIRIVTESLEPGSQYLGFTDTIEARGGLPELGYEFEVWSGTLPGGLTLDFATGILSGIPLDSGSYDVTIRCRGWLTESIKVSSYRELQLNVSGAVYMPGDQNGDRVLDVADVVDLVGYVFRAGDPPDPIGAADTEPDCQINVLDVIALVDYVFRGGPLPPFGCL